MSSHTKLGAKIVLLVVGAMAILRAILRFYGDVKDAADAPSDIPKVWVWLSMLSQETIVLLAIAVGAGIILTSDQWKPWLKRLLGVPEQSLSATRSDWQQEWQDHRLDRREFLRLLEVAYANWNMNPNPPRSLMDVARAAQFPFDLPLTDNSKFPEWAWEAEKHCSGDAETLLQLASQIYIAVTPPRAVKSQLMGSSTEFDRFDTIRMELAKFWDHWGRQEPLEQVIRQQNADGLVKAHASEIKLLTFLEVARVRWARSDLPGKSGLFRLGRRNAAAN